ncbi:MAG: hypothetical protein JWO85_2566 [Candidatus Eremiobacteraeota bacterium]|nr:hypothetical protein [Candidatus Eremiobacteraeota bacterium]
MAKAPTKRYGLPSRVLQWWNSAQFGTYRINAVGRTERRADQSKHARRNKRRRERQARA